MSHTRGTIKDITFASKELGEDIQLLVYFPASFSPLYKYSIVIAQDGRDYFQLGRIGRTADQLLENKEIENIIIVGIPYKNVEDRRRKYHPSGEQHQAYIRFLAHELVPFLDAEFPTYQMGMGRALIGDSLAATVSLMAAIQYPHTFGKVILQSPMVNDDVINAVKDVKEPHLLHIYHVIGKDETEVKTTTNEIENFLRPNRELSKLFNELKFPYFYEEFDGNHTWTHWQPNLKKALKKMFS
ncbi:esterase family protein [Bacillus sp. DTU_2020_1000418_1_SI_GHA_SEK_038]|uniref:alpha/beta hydrolase n=1 Tax=Bacillus sp. DTU_2020_1000418_1_SI_GHA_SEK_038 TaxID=3077585 RepID=UPI0028ED25CD|nr:esterase family protein [Bacillus sp. DTU_2020_1000418_1_SI_GHA_SEK_038]WNS76900.1 esterase family protein [Bacillus sp. DTU_2020_1000418_1_SI_GHA_SEK_038]